jgi:hypothetical protein
MSMTKANKAALLSALIFPGVGLWWLKHYGRASIFIVSAIVSLGYLIGALYRSIAPTYSKLLRDAEAGLLVVNERNFASVFNQLQQDMLQAIAAHQSQLNAAQYIFIACWLCSIISSYFVGKKLDVATASTKI